MKRLIVLSLLFSYLTGAAQSTADTLTYARREVMIQMRDGVKLNTVIYSPQKVNGALPILLLRTPYGVHGMPSPNKMEYIADMAREGYFFVFQDIRGRYKSEGKFEMQRFTRDRKNAKAIDESTDTYDAIAWLLKNVPKNNGNVGMYGISYGGWTTMREQSNVSYFEIRI